MFSMSEVNWQYSPIWDSFYFCYQIETFWLKGLIPATFTPIDAKNEVDLSQIERYCEFLIRNGMHAIYVKGGTGEGLSLTNEERKNILEKWIEVSKGRLKIVVHIGALNLHDSKELSKHAAEVGADAIATLPALYFKPKHTASLVTYCKAIADAAPNLPFYYYHIPAMTGVDINMEDFVQQGKTVIPSLVGVKFSSNDLVDMIGVRYAGKFNILYGCDNQLIGGITMGAHGAIGTLYNFMPAVFHRMLKNIQNNDMENARKEQLKAQQLCRLVIKHANELGGTVSAMKSIMPLLGLNMGPPREPMRDFTEEERKRFLEELEDIGFREWDVAILK